MAEIAKVDKFQVLVKPCNKQNIPIAVGRRAT